MYDMKLNNGPFMAIKEGSKTIELRLNDEKRQLFKIGDIIKFTNRDTFELLEVKIVNLYYYPNFEELYNNIDKSSFDFGNGEISKPSDMLKFYSLEEQNKYGVVAIEIKRI